MTATTYPGWRAYRETTAYHEDLRSAERAERLVLANLLRDIFGNPFRPVAIDPAWLAWNDGAILRMAQSIHDEQAFDRLPFLAEALEDAGCTDRSILTHCRGPGPHAKGCWLVDLVLGKR